VPEFGHRGQPDRVVHLRAIDSYHSDAVALDVARMLQPFDSRASLNTKRGSYAVSIRMRAIPVRVAPSWLLPASRTSQSAARPFAERLLRRGCWACSLGGLATVLMNILPTIHSTAGAFVEGTSVKAGVS